MKISYVTANLIGQPFGYDGDSDWGKLDAAMIEQTTAKTFREIVKTVKRIGFEGIEIYTGHCSYLKRDADYAKAIRDACAAEGMAIVAYAGAFGLPDGTREDFKRAFAMCKALGCRLMAGVVVGKDWTLAAKMLRDEGLVLAYENHRDKSAEEVLARIAGKEDVIKAALDTGNLTAQGGDARAAVEKLMSVLVHLHLKDVKAVGGHDTVALGRGVARVKETVEYAVANGYDGWASIEHEPFDRDPNPEVIESLATLRRWLRK